MPNELKHVAVIADGNGRWATMRGKPRMEGHDAGKETIWNMIQWCLELNIPYLTVYCLSLDNRKRDPVELDHIYAIGRSLFSDETVNNLKSKGVRMVFAGDRGLLPTDEDRAATEKGERTTMDCRKLICTLCINYGGRDEIVKAARACAAAGEEITEESISSHLYAAHVNAPDPDLIIRTGGYSRLSDFLLWEGSYAELYFSDTLFPELSKQEFAWACHWFKSIERTHGGDRTSTMAPVKRAIAESVNQKNAPFAKTKDPEARRRAKEGIALKTQHEEEHRRVEENN